MGGVLSNDFNERMERVGYRGIEAAEHSTNQINSNIANLGNQLNNNVAVVGRQLNGNLGQIGNRLNDNLANVGSRLNDNIGNIGHGLNANLAHLNDNVGNIGQGLNTNLANFGSRLNDNLGNIGHGLNANLAHLNDNVGNIGQGLNTNFANFGSRLNDNLGNIGHGLNANLAHLNDNVGNIGQGLNTNLANFGSRLNDNVANLGHGLTQEVSWFSRNITNELGSLFGCFKVILILLAILLAVKIVGYAVRRIYRGFRKVQKDSGRKECDSETLPMENTTLHKHLGETECVGISSFLQTTKKESNVIRGRDFRDFLRHEDSSAGSSFFSTLQNRKSWAFLFGAPNEQETAQYIPVKKRIEMYEIV